MALEGKPGVSLLTGPDLPTIKQSILETILHGMGPERLGKWPDSVILNHNRQDRVLQLIGDNRVLYRGGDDPDDVRGIAAKAVAIDEITLCKPELLPVAQTCTLDTKGRLAACGTPKGKSWFYHDVIAQCVEVEPGRVWHSDRWEIFRWTSLENPGIEAAEVQNLGAALSGKMRAQELDAEFVDWGGAVFLPEALTKCFALGSPHYGSPGDRHHETLVGFDPAGRGKDASACVVVCRLCRAAVDFWRTQRIPFAALYDKVRETCAKWHPVWFVMDETALGGQAIREELDAIVQRASRNTAVEGYVFNAKSKAELILRLASRLEDGIGIPLTETNPLPHELRSYEWDDKALQTDCVMALALAAWHLPPAVEMETPAVMARNLGYSRARMDRAEMPR